MADKYTQDFIDEVKGCLNSSGNGGSGADEVARAAIEAHAGNSAIHLTEEQLDSAVSEATEGGKTVEKSSSYTLDNAVDYPLVDMRIYGKSTQDGVPTPDAPVDIVSIGDSGAVGVTACGENLLNPKQIIHAIYNVNGELVTEGQYIPNFDMYDFIKISGKTLTITATKCSDTDEGIRYAVFDKDKKFINREIFVDAEEVTVNRPDADYIRLFISNVDYKTPHACYGENGTSEPYIGSIASLTSALPLCGIPVTEDGNYTDSNGQQWICDELIYNADGTGKIVKRMNEITLDGSDDENLALDTTVGDTMKKRLRFYAPPNIAPLNDINKYNSKSPSRVICDKYDSATASETWNRTKKGISIAHFDPHGYIYVYDETYSESTLDEWKSYLASNPVTVVYPLNTPQEINLTAEEMTALKALQTFDGVTNISNNGGAEMQIKYCTNSALSEYVKPIKTGLQKQIDELKSAVLSLGGNV